MKLKLTLALISLALLAAPACTVKSLQAAYIKESLTQDRAVEGSWINEERKVMLTVLPSGDHYSVLLTLLGDEEADEPEKTVRLKVALFRAGPDKSLSLKPVPLLADASLTDDAWEATGLAQAFTIRTHSICRVDLAGDALTIRELKASAVSELLAKDAATLDHAEASDEKVISAPPKKLMEFLAAHAGDDAFFNDADAARKFTKIPGPQHMHPDVRR